jgi:hypothetical protein
MSKKLLNKELNRMKVLSGLIKESEEATQKQRVGYLKESLEINGKKVNFGSIEIDNIDQNDYPDFVDAYISYAEFEDGTELSDDELDALDPDGDLVHELIFDRGLDENRIVNEAIEGGLTYDELPEKVKDYFRRNITMSVAFVKKDGSVRHMAFRRNLKSYEKSDKEKSEKQSNVLINNNLMNVYDTNKFIQLKRETGDDAQAARGSFRNFRLDNVLAFLVGGQLFDMRNQNQIKERFGEEVYASLTPSMIASLKSDETKGSEEIPPYEGPENPMDNQVTEVMIKEGQLGKAITKMLIEEMFGAERGPYGTNRGEIGHQDYEKDMERRRIEREKEEARRQESLRNYETPSYNPKTGRGWTPETLIDFVKEKYNVDVPEEYKESNPERPWMAITKIKDYLASLAKGSKDAMIKEGQLGKAIARILKEEILKEEEVDDKTLIDNIKNLSDEDLNGITSIVTFDEPSEDAKKLIDNAFIEVVKKVNPKANPEVAKTNLLNTNLSKYSYGEKDFYKTLYAATQKSFSAHQGLKKFFIDDLQIFK